jgi:hypothetical protein
MGAGRIPIQAPQTAVDFLPFPVATDKTAAAFQCSIQMTISGLPLKKYPRAHGTGDCNTIIYM